MGNDHRRRAQDRAAPLHRRVLRLLLPLAVLLIAAAGLLGVTVTELWQAQQRAQEQLLPASGDAQQLLALFVNQETGQRGLVLTGDVAFLQPYEQATAQLPRVVADLRAHTAGLPGVAGQLDRVLVAHSRWLDGAARPEIATARSGDLAAARQLVAAGQGRRLFDVLRGATGQLQQSLTAELAASNRRVTQLSARLGWLLAGALAALAVGVALLYPALRALVVQPLRRFAHAARQAGQDLSVPVVVTGPREVVSAARDVEGMRLRLVQQISAARQATEALAQRGPAVLALRDALAPRQTQTHGLEVASRLDPAEGVLAGDWFDTIELDGGRLGIVLGDVAGHGPGPAVFALRLKHLIGAALALGRPPGEALTFAAHQLGDTGEAFATVLVTVLDPGANRLSYANAGHPAALLLHTTDQTAHRPADRTADRPDDQAAPGLLVPAPRPSPARVQVADRGKAAVELEATGPLLSSLVASWSWGTTTHMFRPGDVLLAFTDGLTEARDATGEQFGTDRLLQHLRRDTSDTGDTVQGLIDDLLRAVTAHTAGRATDDTTVIACRRTNPA